MPVNSHSSLFGSLCLPGQRWAAKCTSGRRGADAFPRTSSRVGAQGQSCHPTLATSPLLEPGLQDGTASAGHRCSVGLGRVTAGAGVTPAAGRGVFWGRCSITLPAATRSPHPASCPAASLGGLWHNHGNCQVINRQVSMSWRQNAQTEGTGHLPGRAWGALARDAATGTWRGAGAVSTHLAPERAPFPPWQGCPPTARVGGGSRHPLGRTGLCSGSCAGWVPAWDTRAGLPGATFFGECRRRVLAEKWAARMTF